MDDGAAVDLGIAGLGPAVRIGSGGFADVYRARQTHLNREVAVKVLRAAAGDAVARMRFERECHAVGAVSGHPNIVAVHEGGFTAEGRAYLVMELCPGGSLSDRLSQVGRLGPADVIEIGYKIGRALGVAHDAGVVHRDVKPGNILITAWGEPALADFGIARVEGGDQTATGLVSASLAHAAPEVLNGAVPTPASDQYSLASTLFELFTGYPPHFRAEDQSMWAMINRILNTDVPDPAQIGMPEPLARVVRQASARLPEGRFASAATMASELVPSSAPAGANIPVAGAITSAMTHHSISGGYAPSVAHDAPTTTFEDRHRVPGDPTTVGPPVALGGPSAEVGGPSAAVGGQPAPTTPHLPVAGQSHQQPAPTFGSVPVSAFSPLGFVEAGSAGVPGSGPGGTGTASAGGDVAPQGPGWAPGGVGPGGPWPSPGTSEPPAGHLRSDTGRRPRRRLLLALLAVLVVAAGAGGVGLWAARRPGHPAPQPLAVTFDQAHAGPLDRGQTYSLSATGGPTGATYRLVVDGAPVGTPAPTPAPWVPTVAGRHTVAVEASAAAVTESSNPIPVYVLGNLPMAGFRVNLAAVPLAPDSWPDALARYDQLVAAGHDKLELLPSKGGFWNLFVPGFGEDADAARAYCTSRGLQIPSECFSARFDPNS